MSAPGDGRGAGPIRRILANGVALLLAYALPRVFTFASVVVAARWLGAASFGAYGAAAAYAVIAGVGATLGVLPLLVREIARAPGRAGALLRAAHALKVVSGLGMIAVSFLVARAVFDAPEVRAAALVLSLGWAANAFAENLAAYYQAVERMARWTQASALFGFVSALVGVPLLIATDSLVAYCWGFVAGWVAACAWLHAGLPRAVRVRGPLDRGELRSLLGGLAPFAAAFAGVAIYSKVDVLLLERWSGAEETGLYSAAYKFVDVFQALLVVTAGAVYPHLSRVSGRPRDGSGTRAMELVLLASVPAGLALHLVATPLVGALFGNGYAGSAAVLSRLGLLLPLLGVTILGGYVMGASGRMGPVAGLYAVGILANVQLNRLLVPGLGAVGAATARLGSEALLAAGFLFALGRVARAAPRARSLVLAAASCAIAILCRSLPDPTEGVARAALFLAGTAGTYWRLGAVSAAELVAVRAATRARRTASAPVGRGTP